MINVVVNAQACIYANIKEGFFMLRSTYNLEIDCQLTKKKKIQGQVAD